MCIHRVLKMPKITQSAVQIPKMSGVNKESKIPKVKTAEKVNCFGIFSNKVENIKKYENVEKSTH